MGQIARIEDRGLGPCISLQFLKGPNPLWQVSEMSSWHALTVLVLMAGVAWPKCGGVKSQKMIEDVTCGIDIVMFNLMAPLQSTSLNVPMSSTGETLDGGVEEIVGE